MREVFSYLRVSSDEQEKGGSIAAQREGNEVHAKRRDLIIKQEFVDIETAKQRGRSQFNQMLKAAKAKGAPKIILVEKTDRLTRNFYDMVLIDDMIQKYGMEFHLVKAGRVLGPNMGRSEKTAWALEVLIAKDFIDNLKEETRKGIRQKVLSGGWCWQAPHGYKMDNGKLFIDPERAPLVRRAYELYATGCYSLEAVGKKLKEEGYTYQTSTPRIPKTQLHNILHSRLYIGEIEYKGEIIKAVHEPLIDRNLWMEVQKAAGKGKVIQMQKREFIYRDLLTCAACGSILSGEVKQGGKYTYYRCWQAANGLCNTKYINEKEIHKAVSAKIEKLSFPSDYKDFILTSFKNTEETKDKTAAEEHARLDKEIARLKAAHRKAYMDKISGNLPDELFWDIQKDIQEQIDLKNAAKARVDRADINHYNLAVKYFEIPEMIEYSWSSAPMEIKAQLLKMITSKISIKDKEAHIELKPAFENMLKSPFLEENGLWYPQGNSNPRRLREREVS